MKKLLFVFFLILCATSFGQTTKFIGTYLRVRDKDTSGGLELYPESDSTVLFFIEDSRGADDNTGGFVGRMSIRGKDSAVYYHPRKAYDFNCILTFKLKHNSISVETVNDHDDCGNGAGVTNDGIYYLSDRNKQDYFINRADHKIFFKDLINLQSDSLLYYGQW
jgi:hypothetical protein